MRHINTLSLSLSLSLTEIEAVEACKWLRAAGFPQYAQMYEGKFARTSVSLDIVNLILILILIDVTVLSCFNSCRWAWLMWAARIIDGCDVIGNGFGS